MQMYFPMYFASPQQAELEQPPSTSLFMTNLSESELQETRVIGKKCKKFILDANAWEEKREREWQEKT